MKNFHYPLIISVLLCSISIYSFANPIKSGSTVAIIPTISVPPSYSRCQDDGYLAKGFTACAYTKQFQANAECVEIPNPKDRLGAPLGYGVDCSHKCILNSCSCKSNSCPKTTYASCGCWEAPSDDNDENNCSDGSEKKKSCPCPQSYDVNVTPGGIFKTLKECTDYFISNAGAAKEICTNAVCAPINSPLEVCCTDNPIACPDCPTLTDVF